MGREIKRVALNFVWPMSKVWKGYINPYYKYREDCPYCHGSGYSPEGKRLSDLWYGNIPFKPSDRGSKPLTPDNPVVWAFAKRNVEHAPQYYGGTTDLFVRMEAMRLCELWNGRWSCHLNANDIQALINADRLRDFTHTWTKENGWVKKDPPYVPSVEEVQNWSLGGIGPDSWPIIKAEATRLGIELFCATCDGDGTYWQNEEMHKKCDEWEPTDPPEGEGWQVWETVSEGSPITPVLPTREALIDYLVEHGTEWDRESIARGHTTGSPGWTRPNAEAFVQAEYACSLVGISGPGGTRLYGPNELADYDNDSKLTEAGF